MTMVVVVRGNLLLLLGGQSLQAGARLPLGIAAAHQHQQGLSAHPQGMHLDLGCAMTTSMTMTNDVWSRGRPASVLGGRDGTVRANACSPRLVGVV